MKNINPTVATETHNEVRRSARSPRQSATRESPRGCDIAAAILNISMMAAIFSTGKKADHYERHQAERSQSTPHNK